MIACSRHLVLQMLCSISTCPPHHPHDESTMHLYILPICDPSFVTYIFPFPALRPRRRHGAHTYIHTYTLAATLNRGGGGGGGRASRVLLLVTSVCTALCVNYVHSQQHEEKLRMRAGLEKDTERLRRGPRGALSAADAHAHHHQHEQR